MNFWSQKMCFPFRRISCPHLHDWTLRYSLQFHFHFLSNLFGSLFIPSPSCKPFLSQIHQCLLWTYNICDPKKQFAFQASTQFTKLSTRIISSVVFWNRLTRSILIIQITSSCSGCLSGAVWMLLSGSSGSVSLPRHSLWCSENGEILSCVWIKFLNGNKLKRELTWNHHLNQFQPSILFSFQFFSDIKCHAGVRAWQGGQHPWFLFSMGIH